MARSGRALVAAVTASLGAVLLGATGAQAATTVQTRTDAADSPGLAAADLRGLTWTLDAGTATLEVRLRNQDATDQRVLVWTDTDANGKADLLVRIVRDTMKTASVAVEPVTAAGAAPCQPFSGDKAITADPTAPVVVDGDLMKVSVSFAFDPPGGRFRWAAYGDSTSDAAPYDFAPDALAPADAKDRFCGGGINADLAKAARFPDVAPVAAFTTDDAQPLADRPFKAVSTATDADGAIVDWRWDTGGDDAFDDGSGPELALRRPAGDHSVALKITDDDGLSSVVRQTITVGSTDLQVQLFLRSLFSEHLLFVPDWPQLPEVSAPTGGNKAPAVRVRVTPSRPRVGQVVQLDATRSHDDGKVASFEWDLDGDGETDDAVGPKVRTVFDRAGKNRIALEARDDRGLGAHAAVTVRVRAGRPLPILAAILRARHASKPGGSFEHGLGGWKRVGKAFGAKPMRRPVLPASVDLRTASRLGGSYASAPMPVNAVGKAWITSRTVGPKLTGLTPDARGNLATGALVSPSFKVTKRYLTLRVGGEDELQGKRSLERVEVWVRKGGSAHKVATIPAGPSERLRPVAIDLHRHQGSEVVVSAVDLGAAGHVSLDDLRGSGSPTARNAPEPAIVGFADTHTHAMVHQSFGGLLGHRTYMGVPGGAYQDYLSGASAQSQFFEDMRDRRDHAAGSLALRTVFTDAHAALPSAIAGLHEHMHITEIHRAWEGGLRLMSSLAVSNATLEHVTGMMINSTTGTPCETPVGLAALPCANLDGARIPIASDRRVIEASVHAWRVLARMNADWMEIVYGPDQAYDVMSQGKLAIILGTEVDTLGNLGVVSAGTPEPEVARQEVDWLWSRGIRQIPLVHAIDNRLGGSAEFQDIYNTTQDLVNRPVPDADTRTIANDLRDHGLFKNHPDTAKFGAFQDVENYGCNLGFRGTRLPVGECVNWRYKPDQNVLGLGANLLYGPHPFFVTTDARTPVYSEHLSEDGQRNSKGLTPLGVAYIRALMRRGMLIDVDHMSDRTVDGVIASGTNPGEARGPVWASLPAGQNGCEPGGPLKPRSVRPGCYARAYPIMSSHTTFRGQSMVPPRQIQGVTPLPAESQVQDNWAREFGRTPRQVEYIRESGGMIAPNFGPGPILRPTTVTRPERAAPGVHVFRGEDYALHTNADRTELNDCAGSSKSWITSYLYGLQKMGGRGIGISTDMGVVSSGPRFAAAGSTDNCNASSANLASSAREESGYPWAYNRGGQRNPVLYHDPAPGTYPAGSLLRHVTPFGGVYDFNTQGTATYGSLPDLLQDAVNVGVDPEDIRPLLHSAQDYVDMWRKAYVITGCYASNYPEYRRCAGTGNPIDPGVGVCANTCPDSPGRGHLLLPDGSPIFR